MRQGAPSSRLDIRPVHFMVLAAPLAVLFSLDLLLHAFGDASLDPPPLRDDARIAELVGRYRYMAAFAFFSAVSLGVLAVFAFDVAASYTVRAILLVAAAIVVLAAAGVAMSTVDSLVDFETNTHALLGRDFIATALSGGATNLCAVRECPPGAWTVFRALAEPTNVLTSFSAGAGFVGLILSLAHSDPRAAAALEDEAAGLRAGERVARRYLFCLGGLLTAGMTFLLAWMHWPAPLIDGEGPRTAYLDLVGALSLYIGVGYSVLIASAYLPVMLVHVVRVDRYERRLAAAGHDPHAELSPALAVPRLRYVEGLNRLLAILSPILASAIGSFGQGILFV